jgi:hypothetical protein
MRYRIFVKGEERVKEEISLDNSFSINIGDLLFIGDSKYYYVENREIAIADDNKSIFYVDLVCHLVNILGDE